MSADRTPIAAGFYAVGGNGDDRHIRIPKDATDRLGLPSDCEAHVVCYDDGTAVIDFAADD